MAARELSKFEQDTLIAALDKIDESNKARKISEYQAAIEQERSGRVAAESKVGELTAELARRGDAYRAALAEMDTKLVQEREARSTANTLAAQARGEADASSALAASMGARIGELSAKLDALTVMERAEAVQDKQEDEPLSYRINVIGRDAAGDFSAGLSHRHARDELRDRAVSRRDGQRDRENRSSDRALLRAWHATVASRTSLSDQSGVSALQQ